MNLTIAALIQSYKTDEYSTYKRLSYRVRLDRDRYLARIERDYGHCSLTDISSRTMRAWYNQWSAQGKFAIAKAFVGQLRALFLHGYLLLEDIESRRLCGILDRKRLESAQPRNIRMTSAQADAIRSKARAVGYFSIALAQAFQFELMMRQKDVIGNWVPKNETTQGFSCAD